MWGHHPTITYHYNHIPQTPPHYTTSPHSQLFILSSFPLSSLSFLPFSTFLFLLQPSSLQLPFPILSSYLSSSFPSLPFLLLTPAFFFLSTFHLPSIFYPLFLPPLFLFFSFPFLSLLCSSILPFLPLPFSFSSPP